MKHYFKDIFTDVWSAFCSGSAYSIVKEANFPVGVTNLSSFSQEKSFFHFKMKTDNWDRTLSLLVAFRWDQTTNQLLYDSVSRSDSLTYNFFDKYSYINSESWTGFHFPIKDFTFLNGPFDVTSINEVYIQITGVATFDIFTTELTDFFLEWGNVQEDYTRYVLVDSSNVYDEALELFPEYNLAQDKKKIQTDQRLYNGDHYSYKFGEYDVIKFDTKYVPTSVAITINSYWLNNAPLKFFMVNSYSSQEFKVKMVGKQKPFLKYQTPYIDLMSGKIHMESFE